MRPAPDDRLHLLDLCGASSWLSFSTPVYWPTMPWAIVAPEQARDR